MYVSMGCLDGAKTCELVGLFLLHKLEPFIMKEHIGLYRDDGLAVLNLPVPQVNRIRKDIGHIFKESGLKVTIETNLQCTDFLVIHFNLQEETYKLYRKKEPEPYHHPHNIIKQLPKMIGEGFPNFPVQLKCFRKRGIRRN